MDNITIQITCEPIDIESVYKFEPSVGHGAANAFVGAVRNQNSGREVVKMEYDCFIPLCEKIFFEIAAEAKVKWGKDARILIVHRYGLLKVGDLSVVIFASTVHRHESYLITRYIIEEIKVRAPIWKKEFYQDGETDWVRGHALCQHRKVDHHGDHWGYSCGRAVPPHE